MSQENHVVPETESMNDVPTPESVNMPTSFEVASHLAEQAVPEVPVTAQQAFADMTPDTPAPIVESQWTSQYPPVGSVSCTSI
jgi:hypothetical protein